MKRTSIWAALILAMALVYAPAAIGFDFTVDDISFDQPGKYRDANIQSSCNPCSAGQPITIYGDGLYPQGGDFSVAGFQVVAISDGQIVDRQGFYSAYDPSDGSWSVNMTLDQGSYEVWLLLIQHSKRTKLKGIAGIVVEVTSP